MSAEIENIEDDDGLKKQWGTQWIYKVQGFKKTLDTPKAMWASLAVFMITIVMLLFGGNGPPPKPAYSSNIPAAEVQTDSGTTQNIQTLTQSQIPSDKAASKTNTYKKYLGPQLVERPKLQQIPPGLIAKAILSNGASNGPVRAELTESLAFNGETILEEGTVLLGTGSSTEERLFVRFDQMVTKEGAVQTVRAEALDNSDKIVGLKGSRVNGQVVRVAGSIGLGFIGGLSEGLQDSDSIGGVAVKSPSLKNAMLNGAATAALEESTNMMAKVKDKQPILEVPAGTSIQIIFDDIRPISEGSR